MRITAVLALTWGSAIFAQPLISPRGIVNAATFMPPGLPSGAIARGSYFSIFGVNLTFQSTSPATSYPLSSSLGGIQVLVTQGNTTVNAIPYSFNTTQVNAIMPSNAPLGKVSIQVVNVNSKSPPSPAVVVNSNFATFTYGSGYGPGLIQNFIDGTHIPLNTLSAPAKPGQTEILYGTGLGPVTYADNIPPTVAQLPTQVEVFVGGVSAPPSYSGRSSCCAGLDQINFQVPANAPLGCWVPVQVRVAGSIVSNSTTMAISSDGSPCTEPLNPLAQSIIGQKRFGLFAPLRTAVNEDVGLPGAVDVIADVAMMTFQQENFRGAPPFHPIFSLPPAGSCTMYMESGDQLGGDTFPGGGTTGQFFSAGTSFQVNGPAGSVSISRPSSSVRNFQPMGSSIGIPKSANTLAQPDLFLNPGNFTITGGGGVNIGSISAAFTLSSSFNGLTWTNRDQISPIVRSNPLTLNWSGAPANLPVIILGGAVDLPSNGSSVFVCVAAPGASSFTVPNYILQGLPPTRVKLLQSKDVIYIGTLVSQNPATFSATGIDNGFVIPGSFVGKTVIFQ
jgi:uncharacterized protein (TIGR03437 family)